LDGILDVASSRGRVEAAIGGFHGFNDLDRLAPLKTVVPCHCTVYKNDILERYPTSALRGGAGLTLELG
jgi:7,8-dihydropterin-6-yl-methyl-4-(beta-D-ribofuranosyl)aminobenzene 5'-phosphate synthase